MMMKLPPRPVSVPPTEVLYRNPPFDVSSSVSVFLPETTVPGKNARYAWLSITFRQSRASFAASSPE